MIYNPDSVGTIYTSATPNDKAAVDRGDGAPLPTANEVAPDGRRCGRPNTVQIGNCLYELAARATEAFVKDLSSLVDQEHIGKYVLWKGPRARARHREWEFNLYLGRSGITTPGIELRLDDLAFRSLNNIAGRKYSYLAIRFVLRP